MMGAAKAELIGKKRKLKVTIVDERPKRFVTRVVVAENVLAGM